jgi:hypothetical protein
MWDTDGAGEKAGDDCFFGMTIREEWLHRGLVHTHYTTILCFFPRANESKKKKPNKEANNDLLRVELRMPQCCLLQVVRAISSSGSPSIYTVAN